MIISWLSSYIIYGRDHLVVKIKIVCSILGIFRNFCLLLAYERRRNIKKREMCELVFRDRWAASRGNKLGTNGNAAFPTWFFSFCLSHEVFITGFHYNLTESRDFLWGKNHLGSLTGNAKRSKLNNWSVNKFPFLKLHLGNGNLAYSDWRWMRSIKKKVL